MQGANDQGSWQNCICRSRWIWRWPVLWHTLVFSDTSVLFCWTEGILNNFNDFLLPIFCFLDKNGNTGTISGTSGVSVKNCVKLGSKIISDEEKHFIIFEDLIGLSTLLNSLITDIKLETRFWFCSFKQFSRNW